jgi:hypothetical protein
MPFNYDSDSDSDVKTNNEKNEKINEIISLQDESEMEFTDVFSSENIIQLASNKPDHLYKEVSETKTIVSALVDNILHDESYQEYLRDLEESDVKGSSKKLDAIKNTFATIKVFNSSREPLFLSKDIGIIIGASNVKTMIKSYTTTEKITGIFIKNGKPYQTEFLTRHGIYRILLTNRTKLSDVFRGFIYKLLDHMFYNELDKLTAIIKEFKSENVDLINEASEELSDNMRNYRLMYEREQYERLTLENELLYNTNMIGKLNTEKEDLLERLSSLREEKEDEEVYNALNIVKKKFMKEFTIWLVNPTTLDKLFRGVKAPYSFDKEKFLLEEYEDNYDFLVKSIANGSKIDKDRLLYLTLTYTPNKDDARSVKEKAKILSAEIQLSSLSIRESKYLEDYPVSAEYVYDKNHLMILVDKLKSETEYYQISKSKKGPNNFVFRTSIEHIESSALDNIIDIRE